MTKVILDAATAKLLSSVQGEVELCDESGKVVGWFEAAKNPTVQDVIDSCPITVEEALRILEEERDSGRTWAEIKRDLEAS